jgi:hypothetical protein
MPLAAAPLANMLLRPPASFFLGASEGEAAAAGGEDAAGLAANMPASPALALVSLLDAVGTFFSFTGFAGEGIGAGLGAFWRSSKASYLTAEMLR